ncbi:hypothetical protein AALP_AA4G136100 [Arabis alpina]|uniref:Uncharacterized protein n=1 Tax=Arabis alpina TaxID=50452 RepID=A0A087H328_ARAAL|nr:hypothetical protein AALP_AA4G136100 [Arabis alpina]
MLMKRLVSFLIDSDLIMEESLKSEMISSALSRGIVELALLIFYAMRSSFDLGGSEID